MMSLGEVLSELTEDQRSWPERYPVIRTGEREPIPHIVRFSVYQRDGYRCRLCGLGDGTPAGLELDHMLPWSAGGADDSANLRTLCRPCNQRRSNFYDGEHHPNLRPTTWWCLDCWLDPAMQNWDLEPDPDTPPQRVTRRVWRDGTDLNRVPWVRRGDVQVYCAYCRGYGYTDLAFVGEQQNAIAELVSPLET